MLALRPAALHCTALRRAAPRCTRKEKDKSERIESNIIFLIKFV